MAHNTIRIEQMIHSLRTARTKAAVDKAAGTLYEGIMPILTRCCDGVLRRMQYLSWRDAEGLASETLVTAIPALRAGRCPDVSNGGLLKFLATVARRAVLDEFRREGRNLKSDSDTCLVDALTIHADMRNGVDRCTDSAAEFRADYEAAVATLPPQLCDTWRVVVEQGTPMTDAAAQLGVNRATVWRRVGTARQHMAQRLEQYAP